MKLSSILSRPMKRKDRLGLVLGATLGDQRKKQNNCFIPYLKAPRIDDKLALQAFDKFFFF